MARSDREESPVPPTGENAPPEIARILAELTKLVGMQQQVQTTTGTPGTAPSSSSGVGGNRQQIPYTMTLTTTFGEPFQTALMVKMVNKGQKKGVADLKGKKRKATSEAVVAEKTTARLADAKWPRWNDQRSPDAGSNRGGTGWQKNLRCHHCGNMGHILKNCKSAKVTCHKCLQKGHFANHCPNPRAEATTSGTKDVDKGKTQAAEKDIFTVTGGSAR